jgi:hypothetical protein
MPTPACEQLIGYVGVAVAGIDASSLWRAILRDPPGRPDAFGGGIIPACGVRAAARCDALCSTSPRFSLNQGY